MLSVVPNDAADVPMPETRAGSLPCVRCGYELVGLPGEGACPECGCAIALSRRGDLLRYADPHWLGLLVRGLRWLGAGYIALVAVFGTWILMMALAIAAATVGGAIGDLFDHAAGWVRDAVPYVGGVAALLTGLGLWWLSAPEPREDSGSPRVVMHRALCAAVAPAFALAYLTAPGLSGIAVLPALNTLAVNAAVAIATAQMVMTLGRMRGLQARLERHRSVRRASPRVFAVIMAALFGLYWWGPLRSGPGFFAAWVPPTTQSNITLLLFGILAWLLAARAMLFDHREAIVSEHGLSLDITARATPRGERASPRPSDSADPAG
jgi:hypothetical protein